MSTWQIRRGEDSGNHQSHRRPAPDCHQLHLKFSCGGLMKRALLWMVLCLAMSGVVSAQETPANKGASPAASDRLFFPHDMFWGYGQVDLAPPHNEIDPNLCRADAGISGGVNDPCNAFARYMI